MSRRWENENGLCYAKFRIEFSVPQMVRVCGEVRACPEEARFCSQRNRALIIDIWLSGGAGTNLADGMGAPRPSLAPLKFSILSAR